MLRHRLSLVVSLILLAGIAACSRRAAEEAAEARSDLDRVCQAQRSFLETKKLMRTVADAELSRERDARLNRDVKTGLVRSALEEALRSPPGKRRKPLDLAATKAGVTNWACPELDQL